MRDRLTQSLTKILPKLRYILLAGIVETNSGSGVYGPDGINNSYRTQYSTIRKDTDNLPIAGKSMRGSRGLPFFVYKCFSRDLSEKEGKIIVVLIPMKGYKFIKNGPDSKRRKFTNCQLKNLKIIKIC